MNKLALYAIVVLAPLLGAATVSSGHLDGNYKDGVYTAPGKLFRVSSPLGLNVRNSDEVIRNDSWRGMAVVARSKRYYVLQTELRIEKLASPDWQYNADTADWNVFVPELEALYDRIEFLKP
jgi:hypothetical protein